MKRLWTALLATAMLLLPMALMDTTPASATVVQKYYNVPLGYWVNAVSGTCWEQVRINNYGPYGYVQSRYIAGTCGQAAQITAQVDFYNGAYHSYPFTHWCYDGIAPAVAGCSTAPDGGDLVTTSTNSPQPRVSGHVLWGYIHVVGADGDYTDVQITWASS